MGIGNLVLLSQVTLYLLSFILSFFAFVPVSVHHSSFGGHCALFSNATPNLSSAVSHDQYDIIWASNNSCNYAIFMGVFVMLTSVVQIWRMSVYILKDIDSSFLSAFVDMMAGVTVTIMLFVCAILVTKGFTAWCNSITTDRSCYALSDLPSIIAGIATSGFYIQLAITRFGLWCLWVLWVLLTTAATLKIMKYHKEENIMISLRREKQHLLAANVTKTSASTDAFPEI